MDDDGFGSKGSIELKNLLGESLKEVKEDQPRPKMLAFKVGGAAGVGCFGELACCHWPWRVLGSSTLLQSKCGGSFLSKGTLSQTY